MIVLATVVGILVVIGQGAAVLAFLHFVKSFGAYTASQRELTAALLYTHESNLAVHESNKHLLDELRRLTVTKQGAA